MRKFRGSSRTTSQHKGNGMCPGVLVTCRHCGYTWCYKGSSKRATCPNCGLKTPVNDDIIEKINKFFEEIERIKPQYYRELELMRVILIRLVKDGELKYTLLEHALSLAKPRKQN